MYQDRLCKPTAPADRGLRRGSAGTPSGGPAPSDSAGSLLSNKDVNSCGTTCKSSWRPLESPRSRIAGTDTEAGRRALRPPSPDSRVGAGARAMWRSMLRCEQPAGAPHPTSRLRSLASDDPASASRHLHCVASSAPTAQLLAAMMMMEAWAVLVQA